MNDIISKRFSLPLGYRVEFHFHREKRSMDVKWLPHFPACKSHVRKLAYAYRTSRNAFLKQVASEAQIRIAVIDLGARDE